MPTQALETLHEFVSLKGATEDAAENSEVIKKDGKGETETKLKHSSSTFHDEVIVALRSDSVLSRRENLKMECEIAAGPFELDMLLPRL